MRDSRRLAGRWFAAALSAALIALTVAPAAASALVRPLSVDNVARSLAVLPLPAGRPVIVGARDAAAMEELPGTLAALGATVQRRYDWNAYLVAPPASRGATEFAASVAAVEGVRYARPDGIVRATAAAPTDPYFVDQWGASRIGVPAAWDAGTGAGVRIAIIDTGIDLANPDLATQVAGGIGYTTADPAAYGDDNGHGSHVAGVAAAIANNGIGIAGTAPGARLLVVKALNAQGAGTESAVADGVRWAADNGANVISMSFATTDPRGVTVDPMGEAIAYARSRGCLLVAAAGNTGASQRVWPAAYEGVIGVGATDALDRHAGFSSSGLRADGASTVVLSAPGTHILSYYRPSGTLAWLDGTSMSTPFVSGAAAALWSANPSWSADEVVSRLTATALDLPPAGRDAATGYGRLRLDVALGLPMSADGHESDDTTAAATAAGRALAVASAPEPEWHDLAPAGETDMVCVDLAGGREYQFSTSELSGGADTALAVYAPDGVTPVAVNDDAAPGDPSSRVTFRAPASGRYFVAVSDPRSRGGAYLLGGVQLRTPTVLTIRANVARPRRRRYFTLYGELVPSMPGSTVVLDVRPPGTTRWSTVAVLATYGSSPGNGTLWSRRYRPTRLGTYRFRVRYGGSAEYFPTVSGTLSRRVR